MTLALSMAVAFMLALPLAAQEPVPHSSVPTGAISGTVIDEADGRPVPGAAIRLVDVEGSVRITDEAGRFRFSDVPRGIHEIEIQHIAYGRGTHLIHVVEGETVHFEARLRQHPIALDSLVIIGEVTRSYLDQVGFRERERRGWGHFFQGEDADAWRIRHVISRVPGLRIQQGRSGFDRRVAFRRGAGVCFPEIYLDRVLQRWAQGSVEDVVTGIEVEAIEIYRGIETPGEFLTTQYPPCGAILIWSRRD